MQTNTTKNSFTREKREILNLIGNKNTIKTEISLLPSWICY